jgi:hypothetical protein
MTFGPFGATQALYYTTYANGGEVHRITYTGTLNHTPTAVITATPSATLTPTPAMQAIHLPFVRMCRSADALQPTERRPTQHPAPAASMRSGC